MSMVDYSTPKIQITKLSDDEMIASIEEKRNVEREKYVWLQENSEYGQAFHGQQHIEYLLDLNKRDSINSVVDVGTGRGHFCKWAATGLVTWKDKQIETENLCNKVFGVDFVFEPYEDNKDDKITYYKCFAHDMPFKDKSIDMLTSFDTLEHLIEEDVDIVFEEFFRVTKKYFIFTIAHRDSTAFRKQLGTLHPTIKERDWWLEKIKKYGEIIEIPYGALCIKLNR